MEHLDILPFHTISEIACEVLKNLETKGEIGLINYEKDEDRENAIDGLIITEVRGGLNG